MTEKKKHRYAEHASWCRDGVIFEHEAPEGTHFFCGTCESGQCPVCKPNAYANKSKPYYPGAGTGVGEGT